MINRNAALPAYPFVPEESYSDGTRGLTKRELFAAMAMQGMCADSEMQDIPHIVEFSVMIADKLLEELAK